LAGTSSSVGWNIFISWLEHLHQLAGTSSSVGWARMEVTRGQGSEVIAWLVFAAKINWKMSSKKWKLFSKD
jgi:hypothetical protein